MDKLNSALLVTMENRDSLTSISVDPINKVLFYANFRYWIFNEATTVINKANLDGTGSTVLLNNGVHVSSLANDPRKKILYYVDMHEKNIQQINYDGSNKKVLIEQNPELTKPMSISVFENHAYIVNLGSSQAAVCKLYGNLVCKPFNLNVYNSERLIMVQKSNQKQVPNVCDNHKCDIVCVQAELGPKCLCSNGTFSRTGTCGEV